MQRFFFDNDELCGNRFCIRGEKFRHITKVLRMSQGENAVFCDGNGTDYISKLVEITSDTAGFEIEDCHPSDTEPKLRITVFQCLPKGDKMDDMVKRCVQFGAYKIVPVLSKRCVSRPDRTSCVKKVERLNKIALSSAMQSMRGIIPTVTQVIDFDSALEQMKQYKKSFICYEEESKAGLGSLTLSDTEVAFLIGPEGGLDIAEAELAKRNSIPCITLGKRILRTEDAAAFCIPVLMYMTNNL